MSPGEFLTSVTGVLALMAAIAAIEFFVPLLPRGADAHGRRVANFSLTLTAFLINWASTSAAAMLTLAEGPRILTRAGLPPAVEALVSIAALDLCFGYLAHVTMHMLPALWRIHVVHHSDPFVDVTTAYRQHPLESAWRSLFVIVPVWVLGVPPAALVVYRLLSAINALLEHGNIRVWPRVDRAVSLVWVTPNMHKVHHSRVKRETNSNYGNLFSIFDRLFGTFTPLRTAPSIDYGLDNTDRDAVRSLPRLLAMQVKSPTPSMTTGDRTARDQV